MTSFDDALADLGEDSGGTTSAQPTQASRSRRSRSGGSSFDQAIEDLGGGSGDSGGGDEGPFLTDLERAAAQADDGGGFLSNLADVPSQVGETLSAIPSAVGEIATKAPGEIADLAEAASGDLGDVAQTAGAVGSGILTGALAGAPAGGFGSVPGALIGGTTGLLASGAKEVSEEPEEFVEREEGETTEQALEREFPLTFGTKESFERTLDAVRNPSRYAEAFEEGHIVQRLVEDVANVSAAFGAGALGSRTVRGAAGRRAAPRPSRAARQAEKGAQRIFREAGEASAERLRREADEIGSLKGQGVRARLSPARARREARRGRDRTTGRRLAREARTIEEGAGLRPRRVLADPEEGRIGLSEAGPRRAPARMLTEEPGSPRAARVERRAGQAESVLRDFATLGARRIGVARGISAPANVVFRKVVAPTLSALREAPGGRRVASAISEARSRFARNREIRRLLQDTRDVTESRIADELDDPLQRVAKLVPDPEDQAAVLMAEMDLPGFLGRQFAELPEDLQDATLEAVFGDGRATAQALETAWRFQEGALPEAAQRRFAAAVEEYESGLVGPATERFLAGEGRLAESARPELRREALGDQPTTVARESAEAEFARGPSGAAGGALTTEVAEIRGAVNSVDRLRQMADAPNVPEPARSAIGTSTAQVFRRIADAFEDDFRSGTRAARGDLEPAERLIYDAYDMEVRTLVERKSRKRAQREMAERLRARGVQDDMLTRAVEQGAARDQAIASRLARIADEERRFVARELQRIEAAPARFREPLTAANRVREEALKHAEEATDPVVRRTLEEAAEGVTATLLRANEQGLRPTFVPGGRGRRSTFTLRPAEGRVPGLRRTRAERRRIGQPSELSLPGVRTAGASQLRAIVENDAARSVGTRWARHPSAFIDEDTLAEMSGQQIAEAMAEHGYVPWEAESIFNPQQASRVTADTAFLPEPVWDGLVRHTRQFSGENAPFGFDTLLKGVDVGTRQFKKAWLALRPAWQVGNIVGNAIMAPIFGGVTLGDVARYGREAIDLTLRESRGELPTGIAKRNRLFPGFTAEALQEAADETGRLTRRSVLERLSPVDFSFRFNSHIDGFSRSLIALKNIDNGVPIEDAVTQATRAAGDFARLHPFERNVIRRLVPFFTWIRHITGAAFRLPLEHPVRAAWTMHLADLWGDPEFQSELPDWLRGAVPQGDDEFLPIMYWNPLGDVTETPLLSVPSALRALNPFVKLPFAFGTGFDLGRGEPVTPQREFGDVLSAKETLNLGLAQIPQTRLARTGVDLARGRTPVARRRTGQPILSGGEPIERRQPLLTEIGRFTGLPFTNIRVDLRREQLRSAIERLEAEAGKATDPEQADALRARARDLIDQLGDLPRAGERQERSGGGGSTGRSSFDQALEDLSGP